MVQWWVMPQGLGNTKHDEKAVAPPDKPAWRSLPPMRYQNAYVWILFFSAMDVMLTFLILWLGEDAASEVNPIAWFVIEGWGGVVGGLGLRSSTPLQLGHVCSIASVHAAQNVHS